MLNQLIGSLRRFARLRKNDVKRGLYTREFAASLVRSYSESMMKAMRITGQDEYIEKIQSEAYRQCLSVCPGYQLPDTKQSKPSKKAKKKRIHVAGKLVQPKLNMV